MRNYNFFILSHLLMLLRRGSFFLRIALNYVHTVRYLKFRQIIYRIWYRLFSFKLNENAQFQITQKRLSWVPSAQRAQSIVSESEFVFYGQVGRLDEIGWDGEGRDKLWRYLQNYFDDLNAISAKNRAKWHVNLMKTWVLQNQPSKGVGWEPYPTSIRIVNWIKWALQDNDLPGECQKSLFIQARYLRQRVEWHLMGNHVFTNAKALFFAGLYFDCSEAKDWYNFGLKLINQQLDEQVMSDGAHYELSTSYQSLFIEDLLDLLNVSQVFGEVVDEATTSWWKAKLTQMIFWLKEMLHDDLEISYFNDSFLGLNPPMREIFSYAKRMDLPSELSPQLLIAHDLHDLGWAKVTHLTSSGYIRLKTRVATAILDLAQVGPMHQPGHAHADTLSFELSLFGKRIFVNCGTSTYNNNAIRHSERATHSHNTLEFDKKSSSEVWGAFRVARRAFPSNIAIKNKKNLIEVTGCHDGYSRFLRPVQHHRVWFLAKNKLTIVDSLRPPQGRYIVRYHLHPELTFKSVGYNAFEINLGGRRLAMVKILKGFAKVDKSHYSPSFGRRQSTACIAVTPLQSKSVEVEISWDD